jgi:hypothetical protein
MYVPRRQTWSITFTVSTYSKMALQSVLSEKWHSVFQLKRAWSRSPIFGFLSLMRWNDTLLCPNNRQKSRVGGRAVQSGRGMCSTEKGKKKRAKKSFMRGLKLGGGGRFITCSTTNAVRAARFNDHTAHEHPGCFGQTVAFFSCVIIVYANAGIYL